MKSQFISPAVRSEISTMRKYKVRKQQTDKHNRYVWAVIAVATIVAIVLDQLGLIV
jgi:hypothetical protein